MAVLGSFFSTSIEGAFHIYAAIVEYAIRTTNVILGTFEKGNRWILVLFCANVAIWLSFSCNNRTYRVNFMSKAKILFK